MKIKLRNGYIAVYGNTIPLKLAQITSGHKIATVSAFIPFIFFQDETFERPYIVNHEKIHFRQMLELLFIFLFILKFIEFNYARFILKKNLYESYLFTSIEQEAYLNQNNSNYLKERHLFSIFKYIFNKKDFKYIRDTGEVIINEEPLPASPY